MKLSENLFNDHNFTGSEKAMGIEKAHLYVEKYNKAGREILLDFIRENEFLYFRNNGDYLENMHLPEFQYEPTMMLIHGFVSGKKIREGTVLTIDMEEMIEWRRAVEDSRDLRGAYSDQESGRPASVFWEVDDGTGFARLLEHKGSSVDLYIRSRFIQRLDDSGKEVPCALDALHGSLELRIWKVGQGNTNSISDDKNLVLFDFGASTYSTEARLKEILENHCWLLEEKERISLIISHWDLDHYILLCAADDTLLNRMCGVFLPADVVSLTAKQIAARLKRHCTYCISIVPSPGRAVPRRCGIHEERKGRSYTLYTGERSKSKNHSGLLLTVYGEEARAILSADHSNYQIWDRLYDTIKTDERTLHIVVPHHGGLCGKPEARSAKNPGQAVISVGNNKYGHPREETEDKYKTAGYTVVRTDERDDDVVVTIS